jgi:hypothetical protein
VRNSSYYSRLPHLLIECAELDGIPDTLPILIEEIYSPSDQQSIILPSKSNTESSVSSTIQNVSTPSTSHSKSQQTKTDNITSSPIVRQSIAKNFLSFRSRTPTNINPVVALSNEPFVKLTSYRKFDQNSTLESNSNQFSHRSKSSRLTKQASRLSLPDVPFQRSNSLSTSNVNQLDSPVIPKFLCSTSDKNDADDEVFLSTNQDQVVDPSTFGDSSTKSKVLRESYRRKANTEDRRTTNPTILRSLSTSYHTNPKSFITKTDDKPVITTTNGPVNYPLASVLNLTLQLEKTSTDDIQRRRTISTEDVDPLLLNGLTDDENQVNLMEKMNGYLIVDNEQTENSLEYDRIQNNPSINSQTIEYVSYVILPVDRKISFNLDSLFTKKK